MEQNKKLEIHFGILAAPLSKQIAGQSFKFREDKVSDFQSILDAIHTLQISDIIPDVVASKCLSKLFTKINAHIKTVNKLKTAKI